jgi:hypothetical protein
MSLVPKNLNQKVTREIVAILIIKVIILMVIKNIWFDAPTIPKNLSKSKSWRYKRESA